MVHHLVIGIIFLIWGIADVLRLELPGILGKRLESASAEARRLWQRRLGVLELIVGGGQLLFFFFSDNKQIRNSFELIIAYFPPDFFITVIYSGTYILHFELCSNFMCIVIIFLTDRHNNDLFRSQP